MYFFRVIKYMYIFLWPVLVTLLFKFKRQVLLEPGRSVVYIVRILKIYSFLIIITVNVTIQRFHNRIVTVFFKYIVNFVRFVHSGGHDKYIPTPSWPKKNISERSKHFRYNYGSFFKLIFFLNMCFSTM